ncbi:MAG: hypothetical protein HOV67_20110 [Kribbellaceae bacterium]|nr:hypothetical protein [Kribbellaceae bacterium]
MNDSAARFAPLLSTDAVDTSDAPEELIPVISLETGGPWDIKVGPPSAARGAASRFTRAAPASLTSSSAGITNLFSAAVDPAAVAEEKAKKQRESKGWLYRIEDIRLFTPMVNLSPANDRLLPDAVYAADPTYSGAGGSELSAVPMPTSHPTYAALVYDCDRATLREASDANMRQVLLDNPVDVGSRIVEQPITLVAATFPSTADGDQESLDLDEEYVAVDGNSRLAKAFSNVIFPVKLLPARVQQAYGTATGSISLLPSLLSQMTTSERRDLTRKIIKHHSDIYAAALAKDTEGSLTPAERRKANQSARALNSITVPATVIIGYVDDDAAHGNAGFASAVREVLQGMNVAVKPFDPEARFGVSAELAVVALHAEGLLAPAGATTAVCDATRDTLIGRTPATETMAPLGLTTTADIRAAVVVRELTRPGPDVSRALRGPLNTPQVHLKHRAAPTVELLLRSYTHSLTRAELTQVRKVLGSGSGGCLWQDLVRTRWEVVDVNTEKDVDDLTKVALKQLADTSGPQGGRCLLGVLGMVGLVVGGYLLPAGGSGEQVAAQQEGAGGTVPIHRGSVGAVVERLLKREWGIRLLADAIKRSRAGQKARLIDASTLKFYQDTKYSGTAQVNAALRRMLKKADEPETASLTQTERERRALDRFAQTVVDIKEELKELRDVRTDTRDKIPFDEAEATLKTLRAVLNNFENMVDAEPLDFP